MQRVYDVTSIHTYTYEHGRHGILWRLSVCVPGALSSPPSSTPGNEANQQCVVRSGLPHNDQSSD